METSIIVSLITSLTAIGVAGFTVFINGSKQRRLSIELEGLKLTLENERKQREERQRVRSEVIGAIDSALESCQKIKDDLRILNNYLKFENNLTVEWIEKSRHEIQKYIQLFSKIFSKLEGVEKITLHDLKNDLFQIEFELANVVSEKGNPGTKGFEKLIELIFSTRQRLNDVQQFLMVRKATYANGRHTNSQ